MSVSLIGKRPAESSSISFFVCLFWFFLFFYQKMLGIMSSYCFLFFLFNSPPSVSCFLFLVHRISSMTHPLPPNTEDPHHPLSIEQAPNSRRNPTEPILTSENAQWSLFCYVREANYACPPMYHFLATHTRPLMSLLLQRCFSFKQAHLKKQSSTSSGG